MRRLGRWCRGDGLFAGAGTGARTLVAVARSLVTATSSEPATHGALDGKAAAGVGEEGKARSARVSQ